MNVIKNVLKAIISPVYLKRAFLIYNTFKTNTWDKIFFKKELLPIDFFLDNQMMNPYLSLGIDSSMFENEVQDKLDIWKKPSWSQDQYLIHYSRPGFLEPGTGWGVSASNKLIYPSLGFASAPHVHKPNVSEMHFKRRKVLKITKIISLRDTGEENYFHFFNDVLAKLFYLQDNKIELDQFVIVVSERLYNKRYFQYFIDNQFFPSIQWHIQKDAWIQFDEAIFCKPFTHTKKYFDRVIELVRKDTFVNTERRIFLTRSPKSFRFIENFSEIETILKKYDFETVDTSQLEFAEQVRLFSQCRYLVAIHGAGMTNIIFRSGMPLSLLEIVQPSPYIPFHYIMLAKLYNYKYNVMLGGKGKSTGLGGFKLDATQLDYKIREMLDDH